MRLLLWFVVCLGIMNVDGSIDISVNASTRPIETLFQESLGLLNSFASFGINLITNNTATHNPHEKKSTQITEVKELLPRKNRQTDVFEIHQAIIAHQPDEDAIIRIILNNTREELYELEKEYHKRYHQRLTFSLRNVLTGELEEAVISWMLPRRYYYAHETHRALIGFGGDERTLTDIICIHNGSFVPHIIDAYLIAYGRNLDDDLKYVLSESHKMKRLFGLTQKPESSYNLNYKDALRIFNDELLFIDYMASHNHREIFEFIIEYYDQSGQYIENSIMQKYSGDLRRALLSIISIARGQNRFFARRLHDSLEGDLVDYHSLIRLAIMDKQVSYNDIFHIYREYYKKNLTEVMNSKIASKPFRKFIQALFKRKQEDILYFDEPRVVT